jgi:hypothetical protein
MTFALVNKNVPAISGVHFAADTEFQVLVL